MMIRFTLEWMDFPFLFLQDSENCSASCSTISCMVSLFPIPRLLRFFSMNFLCSAHLGPSAEATPRIGWPEVETDM